MSYLKLKPDRLARLQRLMNKPSRSLHQISTQEPAPKETSDDVRTQNQEVETRIVPQHADPKQSSWNSGTRSYRDHELGRIQWAFETAPGGGTVVAWVTVAEEIGNDPRSFDSELIGTFLAKCPHRTIVPFLVENLIEAGLRQIEKSAKVGFGKADFWLVNQLLDVAGKTGDPQDMKKVAKRLHAISNLPAWVEKKLPQPKGFGGKNPAFIDATRLRTQAKLAKVRKRNPDAQRGAIACALVKAAQ
jgi:hypothetical protein